MQDFPPMRIRPAYVVLIPILVIFLGLLRVSLAASGLPSTMGNGLGYLIPPEETVCTGWKQVNDGGFGLSTQMLNETAPPEPLPYKGEDGFELTVFQDRLYVGMEADNALGARVWRTTPAGQSPESQSDWEEVVASETGLPWGIDNPSQVDHIDSLAVFNGTLFTSSANSGAASGTRVFRSIDGAPGSWVDALEKTGPGFGDPGNENFKDMLVYEGRLCGGTWNMEAGAEVWCTRDGKSWEQVNENGFGDPRNSVIWSGEVFEGAMYFGAQHRSSDNGLSRLDEGRIYRTRSLDNGQEWELVFEGGLRSIAAILLGEAGGELFAATASPGGIRIWRSQSGDLGSWTPASRSGMAGNRMNTTTNTDGAVVYQGRLHVAVTNPVRGFRVWRLDDDGIWRIAGDPGTYRPDDFAAQLAVFNENLYAWTSNYRTGQAVLVTQCKYGETGLAFRQSMTFVLFFGLSMVFIVAYRVSMRENIDNKYSVIST